MIGEIDLHGVLIAPLLVWIFIAYLLSLPVRWALAWSGFYRIVWHRALFDAALFAILIGLVNEAANHWLLG
jgi:hypothetical protein